MARGKSHVNARSITIDNIVFPSRMEGNRYLELKSLQEEGKISELSTQPRFTFDRRGIKIFNLLDTKIRHYTADFKYLEDEVWVIEEVKGRMMPEASLRISVFKALYPEYKFKIIRGKKRVKRKKISRKRTGKKRKRKAN